jgi:hypothetical protein
MALDTLWRFLCSVSDCFQAVVVGDCDDTAEWMLLAKLDRAMAQFDFDQLHIRVDAPEAIQSYFFGHGCSAATIKFSLRA